MLNLKQDLTGTYKGNPFVAVYDGVKNVSFTISSIKYLFDVTTNTISYGSESVSLTRVGDVTEVIPEAICGTWSGTWEEKGGKDVILESNGTLKFGDVTCTATYNAEKFTITASGTAKDGSTSYEFELIYNPDTKTINAKVTYVDDETRYTNCPSLSKTAE